MTFTAQLGTVLSMPGNIALGTTPAVTPAIVKGNGSAFDVSVGEATATDGQIGLAAATDAGVGSAADSS